jgi:hypothetical protein
MRLIIVGSSFVVGMLVASYQNSEVLAPGNPTADLSSIKGTSLVVTCEAGDPAVEHVVGLSGSVQVKCEEGHMHVTRFGKTAQPDENRPAVTGPSTPIATVPRKSEVGARASSRTSS